MDNPVGRRLVPMIARYVFHSRLPSLSTILASSHGGQAGAVVPTILPELGPETSVNPEF